MKYVRVKSGFWGVWSLIYTRGSDLWFEKFIYNVKKEE